MSRRARYDGPAKVVVHWPPGETAVGSTDYKTWEVDPGSLLPDDAPAKLRDELTSSADWTEVEHASAPSSKKGEGG